MFINPEPALIASDDVRTQNNAEVSLFVFLVINLDKGHFLTCSVNILRLPYKLNPGCTGNAKYLNYS